MKPILSLLLLAAAADAALVTTVTCTVAGIAPTVSDPKTCSLVAVNPSFPGVPGDPNRPGLPGYRVEATIGLGRLETHSVSGGWGNPALPTRPEATASARFTDTVTFTGTGPATLRVTVAVRKNAVDYGGDFSYFVGGVSKVAGFNNNPFDFRQTDLDFSITRGVAIPIGFFAYTKSSADNFNSTTSGIDFSAAPQFRVYGASGEQLNITGTGEDGTHRSFFAPGDMSTGPVLTTAPEIPEPGPRTLLLIAGSLFMLLYRYGVRNVSSSSRLPQVTETL